MAISSTSSLSSAASAVILILSIITISVSASLDSDLTAELHALQSRSPSGIVRLNKNLVTRFISSPNPPRPYNLLIFFDANQLHKKPELNLRGLHSEFSLLASSFIANNNPDQSNSRSKLFFCDVEYSQSPSTFDELGVVSVPHIRIIPAAAVSLKNDSIQLDFTDSSNAEAMAETLESLTNLSVGPIHRPSLFSLKQITLITVSLLIWAPFLVKRLIAGETILHDRRVWMVGAVFVYFFSVSGTMYNVIRKMPLFITSRTNPAMVSFFYKGSGIQLGVEGFAVGSLYTVVGLLVAFVTHVLVKVKNVNVQRFVMLTCLFICFWAVQKVVFLDNWKTGYGIHMYWPSSWE